jgi:hypothetical protein
MLRRVVDQALAKPTPILRYPSAIVLRSKSRIQSVVERNVAARSEKVTRMLTCDIGLAPLTVTTNSVTCSEGEIRPVPSTISLQGSTDSNSVNIDYGQPLTLQVLNVNVTAQFPFIVRNTALNLVVSGLNSFVSTDADGAAIDCRANAAITFSSQDDGTLVAVGGHTGAGIGSGPGSPCSALNFESGHYIATAENGAGIGTSARSTVGTIMVAGAEISASSINGAGLGSGMDSNSFVDKIAIDNGALNVSSLNGAGIGSGSGSGVGDLVLKNGTLSASGIVGIGSVSAGQIRSIQLGGGDILEFECNSERTSCFGGQQPFIEAGIIQGKTTTLTFFEAAGIEAVNFSGDFYGVYEQANEKELIEGGPVIHVAQFSAGDAVKEFTILVKGPDDFSREVLFVTVENTGFILTVPVSGEYTMTGNGESLCAGGESTFSVGTGETLFETVATCASSATSGIPPGVDIVISVGLYLVIAGAIVPLLWSLRGSKHEEHGDYLAGVTEEEEEQEEQPVGGPEPII